MGNVPDSTVQDVKGPHANHTACGHDDSDDKDGDIDRADHRLIRGSTTDEEQSQPCQVQYRPGCAASNVSE